MCWELLTANRKATSARESVLNTRPFMEATRLLGRFKNLGRSALCQCRQLSFRNGKLRQTAIQANHELWKYPYGGFVQTFIPEAMDGHLSAEFTLIESPTHILDMRSEERRAGK